MAPTPYCAAAGAGAPPACLSCSSRHLRLIKSSPGGPGPGRDIMRDGFGALTGLMVAAAMVLVSAAPAHALGAKATLASGVITVSGGQAAKSAPISWEGVVVTAANKGGSFTFISTVRSGGLRRRAERRERVDRRQSRGVLWFDHRSARHRASHDLRPWRRCRRGGWRGAELPGQRRRNGDRYPYGVDLGEEDRRQRQQRLQLGRRLRLRRRAERDERRGGVRRP